MNKAILQGRSDTFEYIEGSEDHTQDELLELLTAKLAEGVTVFFFLKSDGSVRKAIGTKSLDYMPPLPEKKAGAKKKAPNNSVITYYDLEAKAPRAMKKENLIAIF